LEPDTGKSYKIYNQLHMLDGSFGFEIRQLDNDKYDIVPKCNNDSWVKVNTNEPLDIAIKNEPFVEKCPTLVESQQVLFVNRIFILVFRILISNNLYSG